MHPTLRDEAAKDGAPVAFVAGGGEQITATTTGYFDCAFCVKNGSAQDDNCRFVILF